MDRQSGDGLLYAFRYLPPSIESILKKFEPTGLVKLKRRRVYNRAVRSEENSAAVSASVPGISKMLSIKRSSQHFFK